MTNEMIESLLMILLFASMLAATYAPDTSETQPWTLLGRALARAWSAIALTGGTLQPVVLKRQPSRRRPLR